MPGLISIVLARHLIIHVKRENLQGNYFDSRVSY